MIAPTNSINRRTDLPPLQNGDRLDAKEFCRRWDGTPGLKRAELIGGQVYMNPPVSESHGGPHWDLSFWIGHYVVATEGLKATSDTSVQFGPQDMPQPDVVVRIKEQYGGKSHLVDGMLHGVPEFLIEVAASSAAYDLYVKKQLYAAQGVQEYLVHAVHERKFVWFSLESGAYSELLPAKNGVIRSLVFPGLWLDTKAMLANNWPKILETLRHGMATEEYREFAVKLKAQSRKKRKQ